MRKVVLTFLILAGVSPCHAKYSGGTGEPNNPYQIATAADLNDIGNHIEDFNKCFLMISDINMAAYTGKQFKIIGDVFSYFNGTFDGNKHIIRNLTYTTTSVSNYVGLFGDTNNATIKNLGLEDINISVVGACTGGIAGHLDAGTITNCYTTGSINTTVNSKYSNYSEAGGLVGYQFNSAIMNSHSTVSITCTSNSTVSSSRGAGGRKLRLWLDQLNHKLLQHGFNYFFFLFFFFFFLYRGLSRGFLW